MPGRSAVVGQPDVALPGPAGLDPPVQQPGFWAEPTACNFKVLRCRNQLECPGAFGPNRPCRIKFGHRSFMVLHGRIVVAFEHSVWLCDSYRVHIHSVPSCLGDCSLQHLGRLSFGRVCQRARRDCLQQLPLQPLPAHCLKW